jgi:sarcosine oxidase
MPMPREIIIIGANGLVGSSAFYQAAKMLAPNASRNLAMFNTPKVLAFDQFGTGHTQGSSHGESRITRLSSGEGEEYVALAKRSHAIWEEVQTLTSNRFGLLLNVKPAVPIGGLIIGPDTGAAASYHGSAGGFLQESAKIATKHGISHQLLFNTQLRAQFPQFNFRAEDAGYCEDSMGYINPDACIPANLSLATSYGGELRESEKVISINKLDNGQIQVATDKSSYLTKKLIVAAGPWLQHLLPVPELNVCRQTVYWFKVQEALRAQFARDKFPTFIWNLDTQNIVYGFPLMDDGLAIKLGTESYAIKTTPETVDRKVSDAEIKNMYEKFIRPFLPGVTSECVKAEVCLYTVAPNWRFVIDLAPNFDDNVIVASPCSGHGAKHAEAIGEAIVQHSLRGYSDIPVIEKFGGLLTPKTTQDCAMQVSRR